MWSRWYRAAAGKQTSEWNWERKKTFKGMIIINCAVLDALVRWLFAGMFLLFHLMSDTWSIFLFYAFLLFGKKIKLRRGTAKKVGYFYFVWKVIICIERRILTPLFHVQIDLWRSKFKHLEQINVFSKQKYLKMFFFSHTLSLSLVSTVFTPFVTSLHAPIPRVHQESYQFELAILYLFCRVSCPPQSKYIAPSINCVFVNPILNPFIRFFGLNSVQLQSTTKSKMQTLIRFE